MFQHEEIGIGLVGFGILFSFLGVILFFDRGLLALGNIFFLTGVGLLLGWQSMWQLFTKKANLKGSVPFFIGLFLLLSVACSWHNHGTIWIFCALQWLWGSYTGLPISNTYHWLDSAIPIPAVCSVEA
ncbi:hypothetical protein HU200_009035 [Digitaria exilis]|uniref:Uncharacterized protein n=1 Tax=Digitaria exilis TaxID=1010633 RepID=A0A835FK71_9POAL|nr:hypothetical protein HU200_009035 [Digitaria exilis]